MNEQHGVPVCRRKIGEIPAVLIPDSVVLACQMKKEATHFSTLTAQTGAEAATCVLDTLEDGVIRGG